jgi:Tfp pilus assembly PilM family ATPase
MLGFFENHACPIGVDMGDAALTAVQMAGDGEGVGLIAADSREYPADIEPGSSAWQRWAVEAMGELLAEGRFEGRKAVAALPASEVVIDHMKMPRVPESDLRGAILSQMRPKLQIKPDDAAIEWVSTDSDYILVMVADRTKLYRHLAIYERAHLKIASVSVWPTAIANAYAHLWARYRGEGADVVMLLDVGASCTNIVICDGSRLYLAHSVPVGAKNLEHDRMLELLGCELDLCRVRFKSTYKKPQVSQIIFTSGQVVQREICERIAKRAQMSAQLGDCLAAVRAVGPDCVGADAGTRRVNWMTALGLSLS